MTFWLSLVAPVIAAATLFGSTHAEASSTTEATPQKKASPTSERKWVRHQVVPGERLDDIGLRYGVSRQEIIRWNKKLQKKAYIYAGQRLAIYARKVPPPREKISYFVQKGDTWGAIASRFGVRESALKEWNRRSPRLLAGRELVIYTNPFEQPPQPEIAGLLEGEEDDTGLPTFFARPGGLSIGQPNHGRLYAGVQLAKSDLYSVRDPRKAWGSSHTIETLVNAIIRFRHESEYDGKLIVSSISQQRGGPFKPHRSHQSGRDIDIKLPKVDGAPEQTQKTESVDWAATWVLVRAFVESEQVEYIFLTYSRQRRLYAAARAAGATKKELDEIIQYPRSKTANQGLVRHSDGHTMHIHVRVRCADSNERCHTY